jgi:hypothetical protein
MDVEMTRRDGLPDKHGGFAFNARKLTRGLALSPSLESPTTELESLPTADKHYRRCGNKTTVM